MEFERVKRRHTHMDIAPLVDMIFLLLLFFMLTYQITADYGIEVRLPEATTAQAHDRSHVEIIVTAAGNLFVDGTRVDLEELPSVLRQRSASGEQPLVIRADRDSPVGLLINIIDTGRQTGFSNIRVLTEKK